MKIKLSSKDLSAISTALSYQMGVEKNDLEAIQKIPAASDDERNVKELIQKSYIERIAYLSELKNKIDSSEKELYNIDIQL